MFINRTDEVEQLRSWEKEDKAQMIIIYGRRRIGKTELARYFLENLHGVYLLVDSTNPSLVLDHFSESIKKTGLLPVRPSLRTFREFFDLLGDLALAKRLTVVIDEFQRLNDIDPDILRQLQSLWDQKLKNTRIMLILTGSAIGMIEKITMSHTSPLFGRRTGQLKLKPLSYSESLSFLNGVANEVSVEAYAVFGGTPAYLLNYDKSMNLLKNIEDKVLNRMSLLYQEPFFILSENTREPMKYMDILGSMASGATTLSEIGAKAGIATTEISKYLYHLADVLDIIEKHYPLLEEGKRGRTRYRISDNFINFWFRYVKKHRSSLELGIIQPVLDFVQYDMGNYASRVYEDICIEHMGSLIRKGTIHADTIGRWWHKETEIDGVALDTRTSTAYFSESKWSGNPVDRSVLRDLIRKTEQFPWRRGQRNEKYILYSKSGFNFEDEDVMQIDLGRLQREFYDTVNPVDK